MNSISLGVNAEVAYLSTGTRGSWAGSPTNGIYVGASPALTAIPIVRNANLTSDASEADLSSRYSAWKLSGKGLREASVDFEIPWASADAGFQALLQAHAANTSIAVAVLSGPHTVAGNIGIWADWDVKEFSRDENIEKEQIAKVKIVPTATTTNIAPQWVQTA